jgi:energy-converting hydrogenase Eha subunit G
LLELHIAPKAVTVFEVPVHRIRQNFKEILYGCGLEGGFVTKRGGKTGYFIVGSGDLFNVVWQSVRGLERNKINSRDGGLSGWTLCGWVLGFILATGVALMLY